MKKKALQSLEDCIARRPELKSCLPSMKKAAEIMSDSFSKGGKLLVCGNGGSAADAQHIVGELMKSFVLPRNIEESAANKLKAMGTMGEVLANGLQGALPAVSLIGEHALETAFSNDEDPQLCFAQQVFGLGRDEDVLLAISTSGNSENVLYASVTAKSLGMRVIALTGGDGGKLQNLADCAIIAPAKDTFLVQECHISIYHSLCLALEEEFFH